MDKPLENFIEITLRIENFIENIIEITLIVLAISGCLSKNLHAKPVRVHEFEFKLPSKTHTHVTCASLKVEMLDKEPEIDRVMHTTNLGC